MARLRSTSKRGIGTLVLAFNTRGRQLTLNITGTHVFTAGGGRVITDLSIGPAEFRKTDGTTWEATARFTGTTHVEPEDEECPGLKVEESGSLRFTATREKRGAATVWLVHFADSGSTSVRVQNCEDASAVVLPVGGADVGLFLDAVGDITTPLEGGTARLQGSRLFSSGNGTAVGTVTKR